MSTEEKKVEILEYFQGLSLENKISYIHLDAKRRRPKIKDSLELSNSIVNMQEVLDEVYPDRWDLYFEIVTNPNGSWIGFLVSPIIHFPVITVTNSKGLVHIIYDIFIKLKPKVNIELNTIYFKGMEGTRMTHGQKEITSNYSFSHLSNNNFSERESDIKWGGFCLGSGEINQTFAMQTVWNKGLFKMLLFQLQTYLEWESIEGNPYKYIKNIFDKEPVERIEPFYVRDYFSTLRTKRRLYPKNIDFKITGNVVSIVDNDKFEKFLRLNDDINEYMSSQSVCLALKDSAGDYFKINSNNVFNPSQYIYALRKKLIFRQRIIPFTILPLPENEENPMLSEIFIKPQVKSYVKQRLENAINKKRIKEDIIRKLNTN